MSITILWQGIDHIKYDSHLDYKQVRSTATVDITQVGCPWSFVDDLGDYIYYGHLCEALRRPSCEKVLQLLFTFG